MRLFLGVLSFILIIPSGMAEIYKWVDEQGKTHYSQSPPPVKQKIQHIQKLEKTGDMINVEPEKRGHRYYCGELFMLSERAGDDVLYENIRLTIRDWEMAENTQRSTVKNMMTPGVKRHPKELRREQNKLANFECRVRWGYQMLKEFTSFGYKAKKTNKELQVKYDRLKQQREKECPADGKKVGHILVGEEARAWMDCHQTYTRQMESLSKQIKQNERAAKAME